MRGISHADRDAEGADAGRLAWPRKPAPPGRAHAQPPGESCWTPPNASSPRMGSRPPASKTSPPARATRAGRSTPILTARKTFSLRCSRSGSGNESIPSRRRSATTESARKTRGPAKTLRRIASDRRLVLISLEFKLFAMRHPGSACPAAEIGTGASARPGANCLSELHERARPRPSDSRARRPQPAWGVHKVVARTSGGSQDAF